MYYRGTLYKISHNVHIFINISVAKGTKMNNTKNKQVRLPEGFEFKETHLTMKFYRELISKLYDFQMHT